MTLSTKGIAKAIFNSNKLDILNTVDLSIIINDLQVIIINKDHRNLSGYYFLIYASNLHFLS